MKKMLLFLSALFILFTWIFLGLWCGVLSAFLIFLFAELILRYYQFHRADIIKRVTRFSDLYLCDHPNLPYIYRPNAIVMSCDSPKFPIKIFDYSYPDKFIDSNSRIKIYGGIPNEKGKKVVTFLGDSVIGSCLRYRKKNYHVPSMCQQNLEKCRRGFLIQDSSVGGYTIQDIYVLFSLKDSIDLPYAIVINCGYASIRSFFYKNYRTDNVHFRKNIDSFLFLMKIRDKLPDFGSYFIKYIYQKFLPSNIIYDLLQYVSKSGFDLKQDPKYGIEIFLLICQNIVELAKTKGIKVILTTIPYFNFRNSDGHKKFYEVVLQINIGLTNLAKKNKIPFIDLNHLIPKEDVYFVDEAHLSHMGMEVVAEHITRSLMAEI